MINTIFYFVDDETFDYNTALQQETISPYTIVFNKFDKTIKMGGVSYGQMNRADIASSLSNISDILPVASSSTLGAIKIGYTTNTNPQNRSYAVQLDENNRAFVAVPWTDTVTPAYDDTNLQDAIATERNRVTGIINGLEEDIQDKIEYLFGDTTWIRNNIGEIQSRISDDTKKFLRDYGVYGIDGNGNEELYVTTLRSQIGQLTADVGTTTGTIAAISSLDLKVNGEFVATTLEAGTSTTGAIDINTILLQSKQRDSVIIGDKFRTDEFDTVPVDPSVIYKRNGVYFTLVKTPGVTDSVAQLSSSISGLAQGEDVDNLLKLAASVLQLKTSQDGNTITTTSQLSSLIDHGTWVGYSGLETSVSNLANSVGDLQSHAILDSTLNSELSNCTAFVDLQNTVSNTTGISTSQANMLARIDSEDWAGFMATVTKDSNTTPATYTTSAKIHADNIILDGNTFANSIFSDFINTSTLTAGSATFNGTVIATNGEIGGFSIGQDVLSNTSSWDAGIDITYDGKNVKIGKNAHGTIDTEQAIMRVENTKQSEVYNTALYLNADNATYNYAFYGNGSGVLNGLMFGYKTKVYTLTNNLQDTSAQMSLTDGATIVFKGTKAGGHANYNMFTLNDVKKALGMPTSSSTPFAIEVNFINHSSYDYVYLWFGDSSDRPNCPYWQNYDLDPNDTRDNLQLGKGDFARFLLTYDGTYYRANCIISHDSGWK